MSNIPFKKLATAVAVSSAIGAMGIVQAAVYGVPGNAHIVTMVEYDTAARVNTLIGITIPGTEGDMSDTSTLYLGEATPPTSPADNLPAGTPDAYGIHTGDFPLTCNTHDADGSPIHWYFYNQSSKLVLDGQVSGTADDFIPFDWRKMAAGDVGNTDGVPGYLIFTDEDNNTADKDCFYVDVIRIQGNWESAAYIPELALRDKVDTSNRVSLDDQLLFNAQQEPSRYNPIGSGMIVNDGDSFTDTVYWDFRYFLDDTPGTGLVGSTDLVVWLPFNGYTGDSGAFPAPIPSQTRSSVHVEVYDTGENHKSSNLDLSKELNIIDASTVAWTGWTRENGLLSGACIGTPPLPECNLIEGAKSGFILVDMAELRPRGSGHMGQALSGWSTDEGAKADAAPGSTTAYGSGNFYTPIAGLAYSLIGFETPGNSAQIQTIMGHERGIRN